MPIDRKTIGLSALLAEEFGQIVTVLADKGIKGSLAEIALHKMIRSLNDETSKASKIVRVINKDALNLTEKLRALHDAQLTTADITELFGLRAAAVAQVIIKNINKL